MANYNLIVTGHGHFATGIQSAVNLLAGSQKNIQYVDFEDGMSDKSLKSKLNTVLDNKTPTIIFTDLVGGTPYKVAAHIAFKNSKVNVVAGCNLASILETIYKNYDSVEDYANDLIKVSKMGTQILDLSDIGEVSTEPHDANDGI